MSIRQRLRSTLWRVPVEEEVHDELSHHIEMRTRELMAGGLDREQAHREAISRFGDVAEFEARLARVGADRNRTLDRREWLDELKQDVVFALRQSYLRPGFTAAAVLTLALGIGATTAIFSVVHAVVLKPFPFADPERVLLTFTTWRGQRGSTSVGNYMYIRQRVKTLDEMAASNFANFNLADEAAPERVLGLRTTWNYFAIFGISPTLGRTYAPDEDRPGKSHVVVLTTGLWQRRFGGDPNVIGRKIQMNGVPHEVIGVMPSVFEEVSPSAEELFVPIAFTPPQLAMYDEHYLTTFGKRRADVTLAQVNDELARVTQGLVNDHPDFNQERSAGAELWSATVIGDYRTRLFVLFAAVALVLVIACVNVANLLVARLSARSREFAIRAAIGAGRGRIVRQVLTESLVLTGLGGTAGLLLASWMLPLLVASAPEGIPRLATTRLSAPVVLSAFGLVAVSTMLVGGLPAWLTTRRRGLREDLGDGKGTSGGSLRPWIRQTLIGAQAALVFIVLGGAALLIRSGINLQAVPIGFETSGVLNARVALPAVQYEQPEQVRTAFRAILASLRDQPGVSMAALDSQPPLVGGSGGNGLLPEGRPEEPASFVMSRSHFITPDYFRLLRIPLRAGRFFTEQDVRSAPFVMIINETVARQAFGTENPIGKRISCCEGGPGKPHWKTVVGVVADVRARGPAQPPNADMYLPLMQIPDVAFTWIARTLTVMARAERGDPAMLTDAIRRAVRDLDPTLPVYGIQTMDEGLRQTLAQARFNTMLMTLLGMTGLALAALGLYSVMAWLVTQRTREIGLRMALGASATDVIRDVTVQGLRPVAIGLALGVVGALATGRFLQGQLFEVSAHDPIALGAVVVVMLIVALIAGVMPASRAARIDPLRALHEG